MVQALLVIYFFYTDRQHIRYCRSTVY